MTEDQREKWRQALAAKNAQQRRQRYRSRRGLQAAQGPGMIRVQPTQDVPRTRRGSEGRNQGR